MTGAIPIRCKRCILSDTTPGITYDDSGICNYCHSYQPKSVLGEKGLLSIIERHKDINKGNEFDCMIGVSGGRDSTFLMWKLVNDYKLRVLAAHYDNPFSSIQATINLESAADQLGVKLIKWKYPNKNWHVDETRKALTIWSKKPSSAMLPIICAVCKNWWPYFFKIANANNISLIVIGSNPYESATFKEASFGSARTYSKLSRIPKTVSKGFGELRKNPGYLKCSWKAVIRGFLLASHASPWAKAIYGKYEVIRLFDYIPWDENQVLQTISENLGWQKDPGHPSPWRFDCRMDHIKKFLYTHMNGVSELSDFLSKMVREGKISRDEALKRLAMEDVTPVSLVEDVLSEMDLSTKQLNWDNNWFQPQPK